VYDYAPTLSDVFNEDTCQKIEDRSRAVLIRDGDSRLIIQGSDELHVLLALSIVEDIVARFETNISDSSRCRSSAMLDIDKVLKRAYSNDDEVEDGFDWSAMPEEVKRAVLVSLIDSDVSEAADVSAENITDQQTVSQETVPAEILTAVVSSSNSDTGRSTSSIVTAGKVVDLPLRPCISSPAIQPLVKLAMSKGYSEEEIENVLSKTSHWKESEFLRTLHTNRRVQSAACQQSSASVSDTFQQPVVLCDSTTLAQSGVANKDARICEDISRHDTYMDVDVSVAAGDDSVILLKSDLEMVSSDDNDVENLVVEIEDNSSRSAASAEPSVFSNIAALPSEQAQKIATGHSDASPRQRKKKKKRKKKKASPKVALPKIAVEQKDVQPAVIKTGNEICDLDDISLIPSVSSAINVIDISDDVVVVDDSSDTDSEVEENTVNIKPVLGNKEQHQLGRQKEARNRSPVMQSSGTNSDTYKSESYSNPRQPDFPAPAFISDPLVTAGNLNFSAALFRCL